MTDECNFDTRPLNCQGSDDGKGQHDFKEFIFKKTTEIISDQENRIAQLETFIESHGLDVPNG